MAHPPDENMVALLGMGMLIVGMVLAVLLLGFAAVVLAPRAERILPRQRSRTLYWLGVAVIVPATFAVMFMMPQALQAIAVISSFGWDAYADGLRVVNKHGLLSNGRYLGAIWTAAIGALILPLWMIATIPLATWHVHFRADKRAFHLKAPGTTPRSGLPTPNAR